MNSLRFEVVAHTRVDTTIRGLRGSATGLPMIGRNDEGNHNNDQSNGYRPELSHAD
jgi:hypothetical protein